MILYEEPSYPLNIMVYRSMRDEKLGTAEFVNGVWKVLLTDNSDLVIYTTTGVMVYNHKTYTSIDINNQNPAI